MTAMHNRIEVHDRNSLAAASAILDACAEARDMGEAVKAAVARNAQWRGQECINLLAPEAPTSPAVRALLSAEVGTRAGRRAHRQGQSLVCRHAIHRRDRGPVRGIAQAGLSRRYADHRLVASMIGNLGVYTALTEPGDVIMSIAQPFGGHSSNRLDGPAGVRGLKIVDVPMDPRRAGGGHRCLPQGRAAGASEAGRARRIDDLVSVPGAGNETRLWRSGAARSTSTARIRSA